MSDAVEGGDGGKKRRACHIYVEATVSTSSPAVRCCGRITPAPCAPRACHNSGEPCRIRVEGCCALLLGGPPAPLPRLIRVKPCLFSFSLSPLFPFPASPFLLLLPLSPFPFSFPFHLSLSPCILHLTIPYLLSPCSFLLSPFSFPLSVFPFPLFPFPHFAFLTPSFPLSLSSFLIPICNISLLVAGG